MLESAATIVAEHAELERQLADPALHNDQTALRKTNKRYAALAPTVAAYHAWHAAMGDLEAARELAAEDKSFAAEIPALEATLHAAEDKLRALLLPRDEDDDRDVILEVKAGAGGEESALFAGDLVRMYLRFAEHSGWRAEITDATESDLGGYTDVRVAIAAKGVMEPGTAPWARLKYEGGVHRVQRVPVTESQGRIHTSAAGVLVMPDLDDGDDDEITFGPNDLKIDVYRSSGRVLKARLRQIAQEEKEAEASAARKSQVRSVDRSERIRTYNFPENRIADHRTGYKSYNLDAVLNGDLGPVVDSAVAADEAAKMAAIAEG